MGVSVDTKAIFNRFSEAAMAGDEETLKMLCTEDAVLVGGDGVEAPWVEGWVSLRTVMLRCLALYVSCLHFCFAHCTLGDYCC